MADQIYDKLSDDDEDKPLVAPPPGSLASKLNPAAPAAAIPAPAPPMTGIGPLSSADAYGAAIQKPAKASDAYDKLLAGIPSAGSIQSMWDESLRKINAIPAPQLDDGSGNIKAANEHRDEINAWYKENKGKVSNAELFATLGQALAMFAAGGAFGKGGGVYAPEVAKMAKPDFSDRYKMLEGERNEKLNAVAQDEGTAARATEQKNTLGQQNWRDRIAQAMEETRGRVQGVTEAGRMGLEAAGIGERRDIAEEGIAQRREAAETRKAGLEKEATKDDVDALRSLTTKAGKLPDRDVVGSLISQYQPVDSKTGKPMEINEFRQYDASQIGDLRRAISDQIAAKQKASRGSGGGIAPPPSGSPDAGTANQTITMYKDGKPFAVPVANQAAAAKRGYTTTP